MTCPAVSVDPSDRRTKSHLDSFPSVTYPTNLRHKRMTKPHLLFRHCSCVPGSPSRERQQLHYPPPCSVSTGKESQPYEASHLPVETCLVELHSPRISSVRSDCKLADGTFSFADHLRRCYSWQQQNAPGFGQ